MPQPPYSTERLRFFRSQNLDESEIMVACLKRVQAVGREYTARMFSSQVGLEDVLDTAEFEGCNSDPLNYKK